MRLFLIAIQIQLDLETFKRTAGFFFSHRHFQLVLVSQLQSLCFQLLMASWARKLATTSHSNHHKHNHRLWQRYISTRTNKTSEELLVEQILGENIGGDSKGQVESVEGGLVFATGLHKVRIGDRVRFGNQEGQEWSEGYVMELHRRNTVIAVANPKHPSVRVGGPVMTNLQPLSVPVGKSTLGRVLDPFGRTIEQLDLKQEPFPEDLQFMPVWGKDHIQGYFGRDKRLKIIKSGIGALDVFHPLLEGQVLLIQGAEGAGKTSLISEILSNQSRIASQDVKCVYVSIGQSKERVSRLLHNVSNAGSLDNVTVVHAPPDNLGLSYLAPFTGATMAEFWKSQGYKSLVIHDCLTAHAHAYNLLTKKARVSNYAKGNGLGLHGSLLERSVCMNDGSSLTTIVTVADDLGQGESDTKAIVSELASVSDEIIKLDRKTVSQHFPNFRIAESRQGRIGLGLNAELRNLARSVWSKLISSYQAKDSSNLAREFGISLEDEGTDLQETKAYIQTAQKMLSQPKGCCISEDDELFLALFALSQDTCKDPLLAPDLNEIQRIISEEKEVTSATIIQRIKEQCQQQPSNIQLDTELLTEKHDRNFLGALNHLLLIKNNDEDK